MKEGENQVSNDPAIPAPEGPTTLIDTEHEIGCNNVSMRLWRFDLDFHNPVFSISAGAILLVVAYALLFPTMSSIQFVAVKTWLLTHLDVVFFVAADFFVLFCLVLIFSPLGNVRLGGRDARPDYSRHSWFAMLFAAGMGIGLVFFGVAEPISHFKAAFGGVQIEHGLRVDGAPLDGAAGNVPAATRLAMAATFFHWGLVPWATYALAGLGLALFTFNKGLPLTFRSIFYPILGERTWGWAGHIIDILAVFATMAGLATSLGFGARQANAGLSFLFGIPDNAISHVLLIVCITSVALFSVCRGMDKGVKLLSEINMIFAFALLVFVFVVGPTGLIVQHFFADLGTYFEELPALANPIDRADVGFSQNWTAFYWTWWVSWAPFVGMFIARISRGRTVREFLSCILIIPSLACAVWMTVFGETAIYQTAVEGVQTIVSAPLALKLFVMLEQLPFAEITSILGIFLVLIFFVTSADSGALVIDGITAGGKTDAPMLQRVFWCALQGMIAAALLLGGGLQGLQSIAVSAGFPFTIVLLLSCWGIWRGLRDEP